MFREYVESANKAFVLTSQRQGVKNQLLRSGLTFHISKHFAIRIAERHISCESAKDVVKYADSEQKKESGNNGGRIYVFTKTVDSIKLTVVAELKNNECWLMTAYYEA